MGDIPDSDDLPEADQLEEESSADIDARPLYRAQTREDLLDEDSAGDSSDRVSIYLILGLRIANFVH